MTEEVLDTNAAGNAPEAPAVNVSAAAASSQPDYKSMYETAVTEAADWKKRFTGLQGAYQRDQQKWQVDSARVKELETTVQGLDTERTSLRSELEQAQALKTQLDTLHAAAERQKIIMTEFPELAAMESKGLLPSDTGDTLRTKLKELQGVFANVGTDAVKKTLEGAVPPPPSGDAPKGPKELQAAMNRAFKDGRMDEYEALYVEFVESSKGVNL